MTDQTAPSSSQASEPPQQGEFGDRSRAMYDDELQDFCIACSFDLDDYTVDVIRNVERRMLGQPLFECSVMSNAEMDNPTVGVQACREEDRQMLQTPAGAELVSKAVDHAYKTWGDDMEKRHG